MNSVIRKKFPHVYSVIINADRVNVGEYYKPGGKSRVRTTRSITKSILATLYGIALSQGYLEDLQQPVAKFLARKKHLIKDAKFTHISLHHLLAMTSGLDSTDQRPKGFFGHKNKLEFCLQRPLIDTPGVKFRYSSAASHILAIALVHICGINIYDFAKAQLFEPLGIEKSEWKCDQQGYHFGGFGLNLTPESLLRIGLLYLNKGKWQDTQFIDPSFIAMATSPHSRGGFPEADAYGYHWWIGKHQNMEYFYAAGYGGQYIFVCPAMSLVVVITSESSRPHLENKTIFTDIVLPELF